MTGDDLSELFNPEAYIAALKDTPDEDIDLASAALALAALSHPGISLQRYLHHLKIIIAEVQERHEELLNEGAEDTVETQLEALKHVLCEEHGYRGDVESYENLQNASLVRVIDRAKGLPVTLCILYIHAARAQGWDVAGLDIPGHFICRLEKDGQRVMFDPFEHGKELEAPDLRELVKKALGPTAELSADYYEPVSNRDTLISLQNTIKYRQIEMEAYEDALKTVQLMQRIDPDEYRLLLEAGVLYARTEQPKAAIDSLGAYINLAPHGRDRMEAELLLQQLNERMN